MIAHKGTTYNYDFGYSFPLFSSLLKKKEGRKKGEWIAKIMILSHVFLLDEWNRWVYTISGVVHTQ